MEIGESSKVPVSLQETDVTESISIPTNEHIIAPQVQPIEEMLGSVTTYNNVEGSDVFGSSKNFQQLRTSARVFKKMKMDSAQAVPAAQLSEKEKKDISKEEVKSEVKKPCRPFWSPEDKDWFFEALNEYGKDFEAIQQHINSKYKKKSLPESYAKNKDQVRHFYYRTWHKVSKHLKFSDDIKKIAQELYALINYGELRKKVGSVSEKVCMKLNELIYRGTVQIRVKAKTIRIKTPMCRALRKLNQLDEKHEELKLPTRVLVELRPRNMESWLKVQFIAQNPRVKVSLPLQRRVSALLQCLSERWRTHIARQHEKVLNSVNNVTSECVDGNITEDHKAILSPLLRFTPNTVCSVEVPTINLSEYLTSHRICLNAYEERIGVKITSEQLWQSSNAGFKGGGKLAKKGTKRQRNESTGEKSTKTNEQGETSKSNEQDMKTIEHGNDVIHELVDVENNALSVSEVVDSAVNTILSLQQTEPTSFENVLVKEEVKGEGKENKNVEESNRKVENEENIKQKEEVLKIKNGWTLEDCGTLTIGELYLMFGHDSKLTLEYSWDPPNKLKTEQEDITKEENTEHLKTDMEVEKTDVETDIKTPNELSFTLKKLLSIAKLHHQKEKIHCPCGHICGGPPKGTSANRSKNVTQKTNQKNVEEKTNGDVSKNTTDVPVQNCMRNVTIKPDPVFRRPYIYPANDISSSESFRAQLDSFKKMSPRYCNRRGRPVRSKHVVVERMLPLLPKPPVNGHSIVTMKVISQVTPRPIAPKLDVIEEEVTDNTMKDTENDVPTNSGLLTISDKNMNATIVEGVIIENPEPNRDVTSPTSISNFLDLDIPNTDTNDLILSSTSGVKDGVTSFAGLLSSDNPTIVESLPNSTPLSSPSRILKENDTQWLNSEVNDYSLTSLLGHLESPLKVSQNPISVDDNIISQDIDVQFPSLLGENGVDFVEQFVDMAAHVGSENSEIEQISNL